MTTRSRQTKIIPLPREMQERWQRARLAFAEAIGATESLPIPPILGYYMPQADAFLSQQLKQARAENATAAFVGLAESGGQLGVEISWWTP